MAWPSSGSTGLVNAVPVLWTGRSSRQNRVAGQDLPGVAGDRRVVKVIARTNCSG